MDSFLNGLYHSDQYFACTYSDRQSTIDSVKCKYQQGSIVDTLESKAALLNIPKSPARQRTSSPSLSSPLAKLKFPKTGNFPWNLEKKPRRRRSYAINSIGFTLKQPLADLIVPEDCSAQTMTYVNRVKVYLNSLTNTHNPASKAHNTTWPCAVCKLPGHDFNACKVLQDNEFLRSAVIKSSMWFNNEAKRRASKIKATLEARQTKLQSQQNELSIALNSIQTMYASSSSNSDEDFDIEDYYDSDQSSDFH